MLEKIIKLEKENEELKREVDSYQRKFEKI